MNKELVIQKASANDTPAILALIKEVYHKLPDKTWFALDEDKLLIDYLENTGFGLTAMIDNQLAGIFVARTTALNDENLGHYLHLQPKELAMVAHMDIAMVRTGFRGHGIQFRLMKHAEDILRDSGYRYLMGTAHPDNIYSVNNFFKLDYQKIAEDLKYGGMPRYIFCKKL